MSKLYIPGQSDTLEYKLNFYSNHFSKNGAAEDEIEIPTNYQNNYKKNMFGKKNKRRF